MPDKIYIDQETKHSSMQIAFSSSFKDPTSIPPCLPKVFETVPSRVSEALLQQAYTQQNLGLIKDNWQTRLSAVCNDECPTIMFMLGHQSDYNYASIGQAIKAQVEKLGASLLVTTSPRISRTDLEDFSDHLELKNSYIHGFGNRGRDTAYTDNPYFSFMQAADAIIVCGDSMSMLADACATDKPVVSYTPPEASYTWHISHQINYFRNEGRIISLAQLPEKISERFMPYNSAPLIADTILQELARQFPQHPNDLRQLHKSAETQRTGSTHSI